MFLTAKLDNDEVSNEWNSQVIIKIMKSRVLKLVSLNFNRVDIFQATRYYFNFLIGGYICTCPAKTVFCKILDARHSRILL